MTSGTHGAASTVLRSICAPEPAAASGFVGCSATASADLAVEARVAELGAVRVVRAAALEGRAGEDGVEEARGRRVVGDPLRRADLRLPPRVERDREVVVPRSSSTRDSRATAAASPRTARCRRDPPQDQTVIFIPRVPGAGDEGARLGEVGRSPHAAGRGVCGVRAVRPVAREVRRQDLAGRPGDVGAAGDRARRRRGRLRSSALCATSRRSNGARRVLRKSAIVAVLRVRVHLARVPEAERVEERRRRRVLRLRGAERVRLAGDHVVAPPRPACRRSRRRSCPDTRPAAPPSTTRGSTDCGRA